MTGGGALVLLSGGIDSAVALYWARREGHRLWSLEIEYHLRPRREREAAAVLACEAGAERLVVEVPFVREAQDRHDRNPALEGAPAGYIPARNLLFYSIAAHEAELVGASLIVGGHNRHDADRFPDARRAFFDGLEPLFAQGLWSEVGRHLRVVLPLADKDKTQALRLGLELGVPFAHTWSCYEDADQPCGGCPACRERAAAFAACESTDPVR